ncbi:MAG: hypothetical protein PVG93_05795 [Phycisphaerales bacterium]|jgi:hypothetical protein
MGEKYSVETCRQLQQRFEQAKLHRPMRVLRYEPGTELTYDATGLADGKEARVRLAIEKFIGGGYAGQVYIVKVLNIENGTFNALQIGNTYAIKILVPPSGFAKLFRNLLYWIGFQGPFQQQVNPTAARAGALWQKFIRRAAKIRFGNENAVKDIYATFVDTTIGGCGEISDWVEGRTWRLEVDDHMDWLKLWRKKKAVEEERLGSPEYRAKKQFMHEFVKLLHDVGAHEFARQYEWSTCKSQPNCLKLSDTEKDPKSGLIAVDFRAGLTLLPFLPMSPGDFKLIWQGLKRGSLVQFDRGSIGKLEQFVKAHKEQFSDMQQMLAELKSAEQIYRDSLPDITHNHLRLLYDGKLWSTIFDSAVTDWKVRNIVDEANEQELRSNKFLTFIFCLLGFVPFLGKVLRRIWAKPDWRKHYASVLTSFDYLCRSVHSRITEKLINWHRKGRITAEGATKLTQAPWRFFCHLPFSILPAGLHHFLTDWQFFKDKLHYIFIRPIKLYFDAGLREQWLRDMVEEGKKKHILTDEDAETILSQLSERYIQRYLISLVVHLLTLPVTQIVSVIIAAIYYHRTGDELGAGGILVLFQIIPVSPGSFCRGIWAVGIAIYDRSFKDYNIAVFLSFFKYIGYLAFPIQMTYHYPALARFMASHWATEAVHVVPVFGERGALLEHWVFCLFYNWPLTIRRRMAERAQLRSTQPSRYRHVPLCAAGMAIIFGLADFIYLQKSGSLPSLWTIWYAVLILPLVCGSVITLLAGGAVLWKRFLSATVSGLLAGLFYTFVSWILAGFTQGQVPANWPFRLFAFAVFATIGAIATELWLPSPELKQAGRKKT